MCLHETLIEPCAKSSRRCSREQLAQAFTLKLLLPVTLRIAVTLSVFASPWFHLHAADVDYRKVEAVFQQHCLDCHNAKDAEGQLILESHDLLMKGGETGPAIHPGKSAESILVQSVEGSFEKDGKRKIMPPGSKRKKLDSDEIALIKSWIDAGAKGPAGPARPIELVTPRIPVKGNPRRAINTLAFLPRSRALAAGRYGGVEIWPQSMIDPSLRPSGGAAASRIVHGFRSSVNAVVVSPKSELFIVGGDPGLSGEIRCLTSQGEVARSISTVGAVST